MIGNAAITNWSLAYEKEYLEEIIGRFVGIGEEEEIERTIKRFGSARMFFWCYVASLDMRHLNFAGDGELEQLERSEVREHARKLSVGIGDAT